MAAAAEPAARRTPRGRPARSVRVEWAAAVLTVWLLAGCGLTSGAPDPGEPTPTSTSSTSTSSVPSTSGSTPAPSGPPTRPSSQAPSGSPSGTMSGLPTPAEGDPALLAAGDIADCEEQGDSRTADLLDDLDGIVVALGDLAYDDGKVSEFRDCYGPTWGRHKDRTLPVLGNHEYEQGHAAGYFSYFGAAAGPRRGYHSLDIGSWHVVVLNSNCDESGGCDEGDPQEQWLRDDLAASTAECTIALWHNPVFSSGEHGGNDKTRAWWQALYDAGAEIVLNGHDHDYERFAAQDPSGHRDADHGITQFVVGTGGKERRPMDRPVRNSVVRNDATFGVLELTLADTEARWRFRPVAGQSFTDRGRVGCHDAPKS